MDARLMMWEKITSHPNPWVGASYIGGQIGLYVGAILFSAVWKIIGPDAPIVDWLWQTGKLYGMWVPLLIFPLSILIPSAVLGACIARYYWPE